MALNEIEPIFVFGSNRLGIHRRGAALDASKRWGAIYGRGEGIQNDCYALPTKSTPWVTLPLTDIAKHVVTFLEFARAHPSLTFLVTRVGCGLGGLKNEQVAPLFMAHNPPENCFFDPEWAPWHLKSWTQTPDELRPKV